MFNLQSYGKWEAMLKQLIPPRRYHAPTHVGLSYAILFCLLSNKTSDKGEKHS